jgi:hypothetical protein
MWRDFISYCSANNSYVNLMNGAVDGEEMIRELEDEEEESRKKAEKEAKEAKKEAHLAEFRAKKKLAQSNGQQSSFQSSSTSGLAHSDGAVAQPKVNQPFTTAIVTHPQLLSNTNQSQIVVPVAHGYVAANGSNYAHQNGYTQHNMSHGGVVQPVGQGIPQTTNSQPQQIIPLHVIENSYLLQQNGTTPQHYAQPHQYALQPAQYIPAAHPQMQQPQVIGQIQQPQMNGQDDESWTSVDKIKSAMLSMFLDKELLVAFKDRGLKGYPPFTVEHHPANSSVLIVTFYAIRMQALALRRDRFVIFEFSSMPQDPLLLTFCNLINFDATSAGVNTNKIGPNELLSKIRLNLPDDYNCNLPCKVIVSLSSYLHRAHYSLARRRATPIRTILL